MFIERVALSSSIKLYFRQFSGTVLNSYSIPVINLQPLLMADKVNLLQV